MKPIAPALVRPNQTHNHVSAPAENRRAAAVERARAAACTEPINGMPNAPVPRPPDPVTGQMFPQKGASWACLPRYFTWSDALVAAGDADASNIIFFNALADDISRQGEFHYDRKATAQYDDLSHARLLNVCWCKQNRRNAPEDLEKLRELCGRHAGELAFDVLLAQVLLAPDDEMVPLFTSDDMSAGEEVLLGLCETSEHEIEPGLRRTLVDAIAESEDVFAAVASLDGLPLAQIRDLTMWMTCSYEDIATEVTSGWTSFLNVLSSTDGGHAFGVAINGCGFVPLPPDKERVVIEAVRRLHGRANTREAFALLRDAVSSQSKALSPRCVLAESLLEAQSRVDELASHDSALLEQYRDWKEAYDSDDNSDSEEAKAAAAKWPEHSPLIVGRAGIEHLSEGVTQLNEALATAPPAASQPFDPAVGVAMAYARELAWFAEAPTQSTPEARVAFEGLRQCLQGWIDNQPERFAAFARFEHVLSKAI